MSKSKSLLELVKKNNGVITTAETLRLGFTRGNLKYLCDLGQLEKSARGVYVLPEVMEDEFVNFQNRFKRGIYALTTALFLSELTDRTPTKFHMVFPATYNLTNPKRHGILCSSSKESLYSLGIVSLKTPAGSEVRAYSAERTLCDILKPKYQVDIQIVSTAFKIYASRKQKNITLLSEYAKLVNVDEKLRSYLEVLL